MTKKPSEIWDRPEATGFNQVGDTSAVVKMIKAAIDGGFNPKGFKVKKLAGIDLAQNIHEALLMPTFWQCAGKSLGWNRSWLTSGSQDNPDDWMEWQDKWHDFIQLLADGHDINSALEKIIN